MTMPNLVEDDRKHIVVPMEVANLVKMIGEAIDPNTEVRKPSTLGSSIHRNTLSHVTMVGNSAETPQLTLDANLVDTGERKRRKALNKDRP